ncbi:hypothetical protein EC991_006249 [Linnemannia zychae]|nr:hypothetical protein EC991_006249 [Linnemannia zychae]
MIMTPTPDSGSYMMDIPELVATLTPHLTPSDMYACILVKRAWFNSFLPHLWATVRVVDFDYIEHLKSKKQYRSLENNTARNESLRKYGHLIRSLTVGLARSLQQLEPSLTLLQALHFNILEFGAPSPLFQNWTLQDNNSPQRLETTTILCSIFEQNVNSLTTITISIVRGDNVDTLIDTLKRLPLLEQLVIYDEMLYLRQEHYLDRLIEACASTTNLKRLACCQGSGSGDNDEFPTLDSRKETQAQDIKGLTGIGGMDFQGLSNTTSSIKGIQQLRFSVPQGFTAFGPDHILRTFRSCGSALQSVQFGLFPDSKVQYLLDVVQESCTNLRHLSFRTALGVAQNHDLWIRLLEVCPSLEALTIYNAIPAEPLVDVLKRRHASTLKELQLYRQHCDNEQSALLDTLEFCPHLQTFVCRWPVNIARLLPPPLFARHISKQWACATTLRYLTLCPGTHLGHLDPKAVQKDVIRLVFRQAEKLDQLTLVLAPSPSPRWAPARIVWDKDIVQEEHDVMKYSGGLRCEVGTDHDLVVNFKH